MNKKMKPFDRIIGRLAKPIRLIGLGFLLSGLSMEAYATNGFIMHGYGKTDQMAGAGTAHPQDAIAAASNPAGMAWVGTRFDAGLMAFIPPRGVDTSDSFFFGGATPSGGIDSERNYFPIPQIGFAYQMDELSTFGYSVYGAGLGKIGRAHV